LIDSKEYKADNLLYISVFGGVVTIQQKQIVCFSRIFICARLAHCFLVEYIFAIII